VTDIAVSATTGIISALVAAALYAMTYFSYIRLLRHIRNWYLPTLASSLMMLGLAIITVVHISYSPDGFNLLVLLISAGFIAGLFGIIAAPALAFLPGARRPVVDFLAKHGEYAGLWMIPPAIIAGFALPEAGLLGMLVAAITIELAWFVRHARMGQRQTYALGDYDLRVLKTQAKGDVKGFAKRHGIRELVVSSGGAGSWFGCGKRTLPCPVNHYIHRLGLNTPPCCREHMKELSNFVVTCLRDLGAVHWIDGGSLLGAVRENGALLAWEDDVDISVLLDGDMTWGALSDTFCKRGAEDGYHVDLFEKKSYITISYDPPGTWPFSWERNRMRGEIRLDLVTYRCAMSDGRSVLERQLIKGAMPSTESGWYGAPKEILLPTSTINFLGDAIACPNQPEAFLRTIYGDFEKIELTYVDEEAAKARAELDTNGDPSVRHS
jgi:hypothetical protein